MDKTQTLQEILRAEAATRAMREAAERERDRIVRDARREALALQDDLRHQAEARAAAVLTSAEAALAQEREGVLAKGRREADAVRAAGMANVDRAVELVVTKFQGALDA